MPNLVPSENFKVVSTKNLILEKDSTRTVVKSGGWAIRDLRNGQLVNMQNDYFFCLKIKKHVAQAISCGLYEGFTWFDDSILGYYGK